jgi:ADP-ribose pyrophosphatase YjhB (NUDIX family)
MKKEKSCGAICYKYENDTIYYLLIKQRKGHIAFPKGHVEKGETEEDTATREIKEETNVDVLIDSNFRMTSTYSPKEKVIKDVVIFVGKVLSDNIITQDEEVSSAMYMTYEDALNSLTYDRDKEILESANVYISKKILK